MFDLAVYYTWKMVEDGLRAAEKRCRLAENDVPDDATNYTDRNMVAIRGAYYNESNDNLLLTGTCTNGTQYHDANAQYAASGLRTFNAGAAPEYSEVDEGGWGSGWGKKGSAPGSSMVWTLMSIIPLFFLQVVGRMKRPDIPLAWREKVTIFMLILLLNGTIIFYIVESARLLFPSRDQIWDIAEVAQHQGNTDFWVFI
jgi:chitin synthase